MKILSNNQYKQMKKDYEDKIEKMKIQYNDDISHYNDMVLNAEYKIQEIYEDLIELNQCLKQKIGKEKIKIRVQEIIIKIGGRK